MSGNIVASWASFRYFAVLMRKNYPHHIRIIWPIICFLILLPGCYPPNQSSSGQNGPTVPTEVTEPIVNLIDAAEDLSIELKERGLPDKVEAWVDELIVTVQPGSGMPEIARMSAGDKATYLHQRTLLRKEAVLRGQKFKARYILIQLPNGQMGWVHEGGIRYVYPQFQKVIDEVVTQATGAGQRTRGGSATQAIAPTEQRVIIPGVRVGPITKNTSLEDIVGIYGGTQVGISTVRTPTGDESCTVVFPGEASEIRITWEDASQARVKAVYIDKQESTWFTRDGLGVGLPLLEVAKVNQHPFTFYGFNWDYAGTIESWKNGRLARYNKAFYGVIGVARPDTRIPAYMDGDKLLSSNDAGIEEVGLVLDRLVIYLD